MKNKAVIGIFSNLKAVGFASLKPLLLSLKNSIYFPTTFKLHN